MIKSDWVVIIEARLNSKRLPRKVLYDFNGIKSLELMIYRLTKLLPPKNIVIATTDSQIDDELVSFTKSIGVQSFRGSENNVFDRVLGAANEYNVGKIISLTGDCPLIDYRIIEEMCLKFDDLQVDYMCNFNPPTFPDGMEVQLFTLESINRAQHVNKSSDEKEHVGLVFRNNQHNFKSYNFIADKAKFWPRLGLTLDEPGDGILLQKILDYFSPNLDFSCEEIVKLLKANTELILLNSKVERRYT